MTARNEKMKDKIRAALAGQTSGMTSLDLRERGEITNAAACMTALTQMKARGEILAHPGETARTTRYSLNPEYESGSTPPPPQEACAQGARQAPRRSRAARVRARRLHAGAHRRPRPGHRRGRRRDAVQPRADAGHRDAAREQFRLS